jgi:hypothetical protein
MRNKIIFTMLGVLLYVGGLAQGDYVYTDFYQDTTINDGDVYNDTVRVHDFVTVNMFGGSVTEMWLDTTAVANFYGGQLQILASAGGIANLRGGSFGTISGTAQNSINIYGYNLIFTLTSYSSGDLTGVWANGTSFALHLRNSAPATGITALHEIPEPATVFLLGFGMFFAQRKSSK